MILWERFRATVFARCMDLDRGMVRVVWDPGWDEPPQARDRGASPDSSPEGPDSPPEDPGWLDESESPRPGRWYAPTTARGKVILILAVTVVLVVTLVACCIGVTGLARLRSVDSSGLL